MQVESTWVCFVVRSGYHNGSGCSQHEPHDPSWGCGWMFNVVVRAPGPEHVIEVDVKTIRPMKEDD